MKSGYEQHFKKLKEATQSQPVAERLRERIGKTQLRSKKRAKRSMPKKLIFVSVIGFLIASLGLYYAENIESVFKHLELSAMGSAVAAEDAPAKVSSEGEAGDKKAAAPEGEAIAKSVVKTEFTEEEINHLSKLNDRKKELDAREEELNRVEAELATQKKNLDGKISELEKARKNISSVLEERVVADDKRVETLVQMYSSMKPQQAAKVIESIDEDLAVEILGRMKKKVAAEVMNLMKSEKAQVLSEKFAGYRSRAPASTDAVDEAAKSETTTP